jgi:hypothetical protein
MKRRIVRQVTIFRLIWVAALVIATTTTGLPAIAKDSRSFYHDHCATPRC